jgi:dihydroorotate dehydrogenase (NAD+) catalytic subunit
MSGATPDNNKVDMTVELGPLRLKNPLIAASGTFGYGEEFSQFTDPASFGAISVKGLSLDPRPGNPMPRIVETPAGMLNAIGLENVGVDAFAEQKMPYLRSLDTTVIANFFGNSVEEYAQCAEKLSAIEGLGALEMNISCPNVKAGGIAFGTDPKLAIEVVSAVRERTDLPLIVKLSPNVTDIKVMATAVEEAGADILSLINTFTGLALDIDRRRPVLANVTGGLSGPAIKPLALRMVWEVASVATVPIIGLGGIMNARDALEFVCVGAQAVQLGTANFINPASALDILDGMEQYLASLGVGSISEFTGTFHTS